MYKYEFHVRLSSALRSALVIAALLALSPFVQAQNNAEVLTFSPYQAQKELAATVTATQRLLNKVGQYAYIDPVILTALNDQLRAVKFISADELEIVAQNAVALRELRQEIERLDALFSAEKAKSQMVAGSYGTTAITKDAFLCPADGSQYGEDPPGPCGPGLDNASYTPVCPSTRPGTLVVARLSASIARFVIKVSERFCRQSIFGNNATTGCTVFQVVFDALFRVFEFLDGCNGKRGDAELIIAYARTGVLFQNNRENFQYQDGAMKATFDRVVNTNANLTNLVQDEKAQTLDELDDGFSGIEQRLTTLETQAIQNSQRLAKILDEQRVIMHELGIEHLYSDPNTASGSQQAQAASTPLASPSKKNKAFPVVPSEAQSSPTADAKRDRQ